jgi:hypothetical protein
VKVILATASGIYDSLAFTHEAGHGSRTYLEWEATAFDGVTMSGIRVLTKNVDGKIARAAIHHRRQGALHMFPASCAADSTARSIRATSTAADRFSHRHAMSLAQSSPPASSGSGLRLRAREARKLIALPQ